MRSYLVVGNQTLAGPELASVIEEVMAQDPQAAFHVVVPATPVQRGFTWDEGEARAEAGRRLDAFMDRLRGLGAEISGEIGSRDPIEAVQDALRGSRIGRGRRLMRTGRLVRRRAGGAIA